MSVDRHHPAEPMPDDTAPDDFLRGVEHGSRTTAARVLMTRVEVEERIRFRVDHAVRATIRIQRARARRELRRRSIIVAALTAIATYNLTRHGITVPW